MDCSPERLERLRQSPVGTWSTDQMYPNGGYVTFRPDGTGDVVRCQGFGGHTVAFGWKSVGPSQLQVQALSRDDGEELDPEFLQWHSTTFLIRTAIVWGTERPAIVFDEFGLLWTETFDLAFSDWPLAHSGPRN